MAEQTGDTSRFRSSTAQRDETLAILHRAQAEGRLTFAELNARADRIRDESTVGELDALIADLPRSSEPSGPASSAPPMARSTEWHISLMGGSRFRGAWRVPFRTVVISIIGGVNADFRAAQFLSTETTITTFSILGGVDLTVPDGVRVEVSGFRLFGGVKGPGDAGSTPADRVVRVHAFGLLGGVDIHR